MFEAKFKEIKSIGQNIFIVAYLYDTQGPYTDENDSEYYDRTEIKTLEYSVSSETDLVQDLTDRMAQIIIDDELSYTQDDIYVSL